MSNLGATFGQGEFKDEYQPLPLAQYKLAVTNTELAESGQNSKNPGTKYLKVEMTVQGGEYDGRKVFNRLNLFHPDDKVKKIAQVELEKMASAVGKVVNNHEDLRGIPFLADIIIEQGKNGYNDSNKIKKYYPLTAGAMPQATKTEPVSSGSVWG